MSSRVVSLTEESLRKRYLEEKVNLKDEQSMLEMYIRSAEARLEQWKRPETPAPRKGKRPKMQRASSSRQESLW